MSDISERIGRLCAVMADMADEPDGLPWYFRNAQIVRDDIYTLEAGYAHPMDQMKIADRLRQLAALVERAEERHRRAPAETRDSTP